MASLAVLLLKTWFVITVPAFAFIEPLLASVRGHRLKELPLDCGRSDAVAGIVERPLSQNQGSSTSRVTDG